MKSSVIKFFVVCYFLLFGAAAYAQVVGQIFTKEEANKKYGTVVESVSFPVRSLQVVLDKADKYVMFNIIDKQLYILDENRTALYPSGSTVDDKQVFYYFSKSIVEGLINFTEKQNNLDIELRKDVLSITYGEFTLELQMLCPPYCP